MKVGDLVKHPQGVLNGAEVYKLGIILETKVVAPLNKGGCLHLIQWCGDKRGPMCYAEHHLELLK